MEYKKLSYLYRVSWVNCFFYNPAVAFLSIIQYTQQTTTQAMVWSAAIAEVIV